MRHPDMTRKDGLIRSRRIISLPEGGNRYETRRDGIVKRFTADAWELSPVIPSPLRPRSLTPSDTLGGRPVTESPESLYLKDVIDQFRKLKDLGDKALAQVRDEDLFVTLDPESNSLAILIQHMAGNLLSRWTDFLNSDGEKPNRD